MTTLEIVFGVALAIAAIGAVRWRRRAMAWNRDLNWFLNYVGQALGAPDKELFAEIRDHAARDSAIARAIRLHWTLRHRHEIITDSLLEQLAASVERDARGAT